jgi:phosphocarrier protein HPr
MSDALRCTVKIVNPRGLHLRPIRVFVERARQFQSGVQVTAGGRPPVNGLSPMALMGLAAGQGTELTLEVDGPDAADALKALTEVLAQVYPDDEDDAPLPAEG